MSWRIGHSRYMYVCSPWFHMQHMRAALSHVQPRQELPGMPSVVQVHFPSSLSQVSYHSFCTAHTLFAQASSHFTYFRHTFQFLWTWPSCKTSHPCPSYLARECTVRPCFRSPTIVMVSPFTVPISSRMVKTSRSAWVGCSPMPSPALIRGFRQ